MTTTRPGQAGTDEAAILTAVSSRPRPAPPSPLQAVMAFGWRGVLKIKHVPEQLLDSTVTPVLFTLMFTFIFGGAIAGDTGEYLDYILPGVLVMSTLFTTVYSGVAISTDRTKGVTDRFLSLPIWRPSPLLGSLLGDGVRYLVTAVVVVAVGLALGFRPDGGVGGVAAAMALTIGFSFALAWVFTTVGLLMRTPSAVLNGGFMVLFPLTFLSNVFVEPETLPAPLEAFVDANPVSVLVTACRGLMAGSPDSTDILIVLAVAAGLIAIFAPLTSRLYRRPA
ncbi:MAG TPA: ABC transporter permease [Miltoncostaeaceae bacterium]|nr:ABC transporter permease [Miltoncostaeaceae bacterium]